MTKPEHSEPGPAAAPASGTPATASPVPGPRPAAEPTPAGPVPQPYLHELVTCVRAPVVVLSGPDGQIRAGGAQGLFCHDRRMLREAVVRVDGAEPVPAGGGPAGADRARFFGVVRHLGDPIPDPTVWLRRHRRTGPDGCDETLELVNASRAPVTATVTVTVSTDFAPVAAVKRGQAPPVVPPEPVGGGLRWRGPGDLSGTEAGVWATGDPRLTDAGLCWEVSVPARGSWRAELAVRVTGQSLGAAGFAAAAADADPTGLRVTGHGGLAASVARGMADLAALTLAGPADHDGRTDPFPAAGAPWYLTLFGRDALWTARLALPAGTGLAAGTLRTLAARQGRRHDPETAEEPGKILHEVRTPTAGHGLPPVYYGTVDATALWVCLLHDAWLWGMPPREVAALLPPLRAALGWLRDHADPGGGGFLTYADPAGAGLTNQGWKDSVDAVQFPDATLATPPVALAEAQAYAYQAATAGAAVLDVFDRPGAGAPAREWADGLRQRFRERFWVGDRRGRYPALALAGSGTPVPTAASNLGHLLGTGLLDPTEAAAVAARLAEPDLDSGYGLRTLSADAAGFNPFGYHTGSVWAHDTAIAVRGLAAEGHAGTAAALARGLLRVAPRFEHRMPELHAGTDRRAGEPVLAYPAACRPQAWAAAAPVALLQAALGLQVDVPAGWLRVAPPPQFAAWFPLRVTGLRVAGHPLAVSVDADGRAEVTTGAPVTVTVVPSAAAGRS